MEVIRNEKREADHSGVALSRREYVELRSTRQVAKLRCVERVEVIAVSSTREVAE